MKHTYSCFLLAGSLALAALAATAQTAPGVGIGTTAPDASAALDIVSSAKGALLPRLTEAARLVMGTGAVPAPATGLLVYQTDGAQPGFYYASGPTTWTRLADGTTADGRYVQNQTAADQAGGFRLGGNGLVGGRLGIGSPAPATRLSISPTLIEPKITLWDGGSSATHYGFGVSGGQLNYHVDLPASSHVFAVGGKNSDGTELLRIQGNGRVGVGTSAPASQLANTSLNTTDSDAQGGSVGALSWATSLDGYVGQLYNGGTTSGSNGLLVKVDGSNPTARVLDLSKGAQAAAGSRLLTVLANGKVGVGTGNPAGQLANTALNTISSDTYGGNTGSLSWAASQAGYAAQLYNGGAGRASNGLLVKVADATATVLDLSRGPQTTPGTQLLTVQASGAVTMSTLVGNGTRVVTTTGAGLLGSATPASLDATTAANGLNLAGTAVRLGGTLSQDTELVLDSHDLTVTGATMNPTQLTQLAPGRDYLTTAGILGQTFQLPAGAVIQALDIFLRFGTTGEVKFYQGAPGGPLLGSQQVTYTPNYGTTHVVLDNPITVGAAGTYSFSTGYAGPLYVNDDNPYPGGTLYNGGSALPGYDVSFVLYYVGPTPAPALHIDATRHVGIGTASPVTSLDVDGALALRPADAGPIALTTDNQLIPVGDRSYLRLASNSTTATSRTFTLGNGTQPGQLLYLEGANTLNNAQCELLDTGNVNLPVNRIISYADVLTLLWNGTQWLEVSYTNN